jgi:hypothetical protein
VGIGNDILYTYLTLIVILGGILCLLFWAASDEYEINHQQQLELDFETLAKAKFGEEATVFRILNDNSSVIEKNGAFFYVWSDDERKKIIYSESISTEMAIKLKETDRELTFNDVMSMLQEMTP